MNKEYPIDSAQYAPSGNTPTYYACLWETDGEMCTESCSDLTQLVDHIKVFHVPKGMKNCICHWMGCALGKKTFNRRQQLLDHLRVHTRQQPYECDICQKKFANASNCRTHKLVHKGEKQFECDVPGCSQSFITFARLSQHALIHGESKPFRCPHCNMDFKYERTLKSHLKMVHKPPEPSTSGPSTNPDDYPLQYGEGSSTMQQSYGYGAYPEPSEDQHLANNSNQCLWDTNGAQCMQMFPDVKSLAEHIDEFHVPIRIKDLTCHWKDCEREQKPFDTRYVLIEHIRTHTGERPLVCDICQKTFAKSLNLNLHKRTHTGETPFKCAHEGCSQAFSKSSKLARHVLTHKGDKRFPCPNCQMTYKRADGLKRHLESGHSTCKPSTSGSLNAPQTSNVDDQQDPSMKQNEGVASTSTAFSHLQDPKQAPQQDPSMGQDSGVASTSAAPSHLQDSYAPQQDQLMDQDSAVPSTSAASRHLQGPRQLYQESHQAPQQDPLMGQDTGLASMSTAPSHWQDPHQAPQQGPSVVQDSGLPSTPTAPSHLPGYRQGPNQAPQQDPSVSQHSGLASTSNAPIHLQGPQQDAYQAPQHDPLMGQNSGLPTSAVLRHLQDPYQLPQQDLSVAQHSGVASTSAASSRLQESQRAPLMSQNTGLPCTSTAPTHLPGYQEDTSLEALYQIPQQPPFVNTGLTPTFASTSHLQDLQPVYQGPYQGSQQDPFMGVLPSTSTGPSHLPGYQEGSSLEDLYQLPQQHPFVAQNSGLASTSAAPSHPHGYQGVPNPYQVPNEYRCMNQDGSTSIAPIALPVYQGDPAQLPQYPYQGQYFQGGQNTNMPPGPGFL